MACPRCGIEPTGCLCQVDDTDCFEVSGIGTEGSPFLVEPIIDPTEGLLTCSPDGLSAELETEVRVPPSCQLRQFTGQQTVAGGAVQVVEFDAVGFDTDGMASLGNNRIIVQTPGIYLVTFNLRFNTSIFSDGRGGLLTVNGSGNPPIAIFSGASGPVNAQVGTLWSFATNDFLQLVAFNANPSGSSTISRLAFSPVLTATFVREPI